MKKLIYVIHVINTFLEMSLDLIPDELKDFKKIEKISISKRIIFKKKNSNNAWKGRICKN